MVESDDGHDDDFHIEFRYGHEFISTPTEMERVNSNIDAFINAIVGEDEKKEKEYEENEDKEIGELEQDLKRVEKEENANKQGDNQNEWEAKEGDHRDIEMPKEEIGTNGLEEEEKANKGEDNQNEGEGGAKEDDQGEVEMPKKRLRQRG